MLLEWKERVEVGEKHKEKGISEKSGGSSVCRECV